MPSRSVRRRPVTSARLRAAAFPKPRSALLRSRTRPGYIFLVSVLIIGAIGAATVGSLLLLGLAAQMSGRTIVESTQSLELAQSCAERALRSLRNDITYYGNETLTFSEGSCFIGRIRGAGNTGRSLCIQASSSRTTRRIQVTVARVLPSTVISSWSEASAFTQC